MTPVLLRRGRASIPLFNASLGMDDVTTARSWLRRRDEWRDDGVVTAFERAFALWNETPHAVAFMGGRVALSAALDALEIAAGDEVIIPAYSCVVVPNALKFAGVIPVASDIELDTFGLDVADVERRIGPRTRAILLHHLYGLVCRDYEAIVSLARRRGLAIIEDCAQAAGARYGGRPVGNLGDVAIFSTEQSKHLNTIQGGLALTGSDVIAERLRHWQHAAPWPDPERIEALLRTVILAHARTAGRRAWNARLTVFRHASAQMPSTTAQEERGERPAHYGARMPAPIAALGLNQLAKVDVLNERRRRRATQWDDWCRREGYVPAHVVSGSVPTFLRYPVLVEPEHKRDRSWGRALNVDVGIWFMGKQHPVDIALADCPRADEAVSRCINLPCLAPGDAEDG